MRIDLGEQITKPETIAQCELYYDEIVQKLAEKEAADSPRKPPVTSEG